MFRSRSLSVLSVALVFFGAAVPGWAAVYNAVLSGAAEDPPNASPGTGTAIVELDLVAHTLHVQAQFSDLIGTTTLAHIHAPTAVPGAGTAGIATMTPTFLGFPAGVTSGIYDATFDTLDASTYSAPFVTANGGTAAGAEAALAASLAAGTAYFNIHTTEFPGGEIRGFLVPEPAALGMLLVAAGVLRRRGLRGDRGLRVED